MGVAWLASDLIMKFSRSILIFVIAVLATGCEENPVELTIVKPGTTLDAGILHDVVNLLGQDAEVSIKLTGSGQSDEAAIDALISGDADIALVSNNMPYRTGISTVLPLYPTVLHVGFLSKRDFVTPAKFIRGARIFAGSDGSASRMMFENFTRRLGLTPADFSYVDVSNPVEPPEVFVVFAPTSPDRLTELQRDFPECE